MMIVDFAGATEEWLLKEFKNKSEQDRYRDDKLRWFFGDIAGFYPHALAANDVCVTVQIDGTLKPNELRLLIQMIIVFEGNPYTLRDISPEKESVWSRGIDEAEEYVRPYIEAVFVRAPIRA